MPLPSRAGVKATGGNNPDCPGKDLPRWWLERELAGPDVYRRKQCTFSRRTHNNPAERALRGVALGKNYLFAGSDAGGKRAAALYSLIGAAKLNSLDPESYLPDVLSRIAIPNIGLTLFRPQ
jgi:hypothetical protein